MSAQAKGLGIIGNNPLHSPNGAALTRLTKMPQSLSKVLVHLVYSTKNRHPWLNDANLRQELYAYKAAILRDNVDSPALAINGIANHVHNLLLLSRKFALKDIVEEAKTETTKWLKKQGPSYTDFHWQAGYGAFSVSQSNVGKVKQYFANQEAHHARTSYQDEYRTLCRRHGIELDERYAWE
jgi:putative transposase